jgi:hypothetical protein
VIDASVHRRHESVSNTLINLVMVEWQCVISDNLTIVYETVLLKQAIAQDQCVVGVVSMQNNGETDSL